MAGVIKEMEKAGMDPELSLSASWLGRDDLHLIAAVGREECCTSKKVVGDLI